MAVSFSGDEANSFHHDAYNLAGLCDYVNTAKDNDTQKVSIRFYNDCEVRAVWIEEKNKWFFSVLDVIGAINEQDDYAKTRNYWKYLKTKLKKEKRKTS